MAVKSLGAALAATIAAISTWPNGGSAAPAGQSCFFINQFRTWKAPDARTIYIRVNPNRFYRLDLAGRCEALLWPDGHLVTDTRGSDTVCSALDWNLKVSQVGIAEPCIVKKMTELTPAEAEAIPKKFKP
jgi:hypothetical protein